MATFTQTSSSRTVTRQSTVVDATGNVLLTLSIADAAGLILETRTVRIPSDGTAITDTMGNQIAASVPAGLANSITTFTAALDSAVSNAATAGKFSR